MDFIKDGKANFDRDGYYVIRPDMTALDQIEFVARDTPLKFQEIYEIIGNGCDIIERVEWASSGFDVVQDKNRLVGWRADPREEGTVVNVWLDEEGMYRQPRNPLATALAQRIGFIDMSHGLWGTVVVACGKADEKE